MKDYLKKTILGQNSCSNKILNKFEEFLNESRTDRIVFSAKTELKTIEYEMEKIVKGGKIESRIKWVPPEGHVLNFLGMNKNTRCFMIKDTAGEEIIFSVYSSGWVEEMDLPEKIINAIRKKIGII